MKADRKKECEEVIRKFEEIRMRGRKRTMVGWYHFEFQIILNHSFSLWSLSLISVLLNVKCIEYKPDLNQHILGLLVLGLI